MSKVKVIKKNPMVSLLGKMSKGVLISSLSLHLVSSLDNIDHMKKLFPQKEVVKKQEVYKPKIRKIKPVKTVKPVMKVKAVHKKNPVKVTPLHSVAKPQPKPVSTVTVEATAYTASCVGCSGITATGLDVRYSTPNIIAVDPRVIPLGTKVRMRQGNAVLGVYTASDTGGAIKGNRIDVLVSSYDKAIQFGRKQVTLEILN